MNKNVFMIGLGLIGGSIALAIKKEHPTAIITGYDINQEQLELAQSLKVIDEAIKEIEHGSVNADLIIISTPVLITEKIIDQLLKCELRENTIITDVGSTKQKIVKRADLFREKGITFIGGHPLAGSHKSGVGAANARLFENAFYVLTPNGDEQEEKVKELELWLTGTHANFLHLSPAEHDHIVGAISHFPHIVAASLVHHLAGMEEGEVNLSRLAAGGFRDITRIASSSPTMWHDILMHNKEVLLELLDNWNDEMQRVKTMLENAKSEDIFTYFKEAKMFRDDMPQRKKGALPPIYDLYVDVPDYPGIIAKITGILADEGISITNIQIIETREDIIGALRLTFRSEKDLKHAQETLHQENYKTYLSP